MKPCIEGQWYDWYAWRPVSSEESGSWIWLQMAQRKECCHTWAGSVVHYRTRQEAFRAVLEGGE